MTDDLPSRIADTSAAMGGGELDDLLKLFASVAGAPAELTLRRRLGQQILRAVEIALLDDQNILDIALNPGLYLGRETSILTERLGTLTGGQPAAELVRHLRGLVLSRVAGAAHRAALGPFETRVLERHREQFDMLRCLDCGYHFVEEDLGQSRLDLARSLGFEFAPEKLARRLRDPWKPSTNDHTRLSIDHIIPVAGLGPTDLGNLRVVCRFCNGEKRLYRWAGEAFPRDVAASFLALQPSSTAWAAQAGTYIAILDSGGICSICGAQNRDVELTARPRDSRSNSSTAPWHMQAVCYRCYDPSA